MASKEATMTSPILIGVSSNDAKWAAFWMWAAYFMSAFTVVLLLVAPGWMSVSAGTWAALAFTKFEVLSLRADLTRGAPQMRAPE
jgi:hypothetical protein